ncbi:hypothetical protein ACQ4LE_004457 [Meloidogyne hapla]|uniref:Uncharacterized protein n=1 Tax=Meloidogyne hapla TaxID=6305 RepID=A0A1I8BPM1_MELHA
MFFKNILIIFVFLTINCEVLGAKRTKNKESNKETEPIQRKIFALDGNSSFKDTIEMINKEENENNISSNPRFYKANRTGSNGKDKQKVDIKKSKNQVEKRMFDLGDPNYNIFNSGYNTGNFIRAGKLSEETKINGANGIQGMKHAILSKLKRSKSESSNIDNKLPVAQLKRSNSFKRRIIIPLESFLNKWRGKNDQSSLYNEVEKLREKKLKEVKLKEYEIINNNAVMTPLHDEILSDSSEYSPINFSGVSLKKGEGSSFSSSNPQSLRNSLSRSFPFNQRASDVTKEKGFENFEEDWKDRDSDDFIELDLTDGKNKEDKHIEGKISGFIELDLNEETNKYNQKVTEGNGVEHGEKVKQTAKQENFVEDKTENEKDREEGDDFIVYEFNTDGSRKKN